MSLTVEAALKEAAEQLALSQSPSAKIDAAVLLCHALDKPNSFLFTWPDKTLSKSELALFQTLIERRCQGEPVAYITGTREFWSLSLEVEPSTLIPRPDTERLVELALDKITAETRRVLDLGTGTGAIALAIATECSQLAVTGVDLKPEAVALAARNRERLGLKNVEFRQSSWFDSFGISISEAFDVIVSNPPYIDPDDPHLAQGDVRFEPSSALTADDHGLADIKVICQQSPSYLASGGWLLIEHGYDQRTAVQQIFSDAGFTEVETIKDYAGQDRVTQGRFCRKQ
ncbi:protein-(glutamine-N5) methyltransferase, release factor-specific [Veronia nyctiphanis]|uniref:Release factor glutamine methyltransferase n=1 Tax=Veronia nyctiphanis TaxID=1278244 RepID=A0A4Q0YXE5_9GAMM|nr:peptide chain release factor N(5)-glutamine methyltransferase [Veronia nyctiphanis]RXJ73869.1 protein-(glutamine-N5) methyltransferase, release factor-specific [Veronia nyctiphanis]